MINESKEKSKQILNHIKHLFLTKRLTLFFRYGNLNQHRRVEQLEARRAHNPEVVGSSPASATRITPKTVRFWGFYYAKSWIFSMHDWVI